MLAVDTTDTTEAPLISVQISGWIAPPGVASGPVEWMIADGATGSMILAGVELLNVVPVSCWPAFVGDVTGDDETSDLLGLPLRRLAGDESGTAGAGDESGTAGAGSILVSTGSIELSAGTSNLLPLEISKSSNTEPG